MPSIINATTTNGVAISPDNSGSLQLATNNGTTAVTIDTSQNVGIGETSPAGSAGYTQLVVRGSSGAELSLKGGTTQYGYVYVDNGGFRIINPQSGASSGTLQFSTSNTERMRIDASGNVGIGTTSSGNKFEVAGSGMFSGAVTTNTTGTHISYQSGNSQIGAWGADTSTNGTLVFFSARSNGVNGLERMRIDSSGNLLVGKTTDAGNTAGFVVRQLGETNIAVANSEVMNINRISSDGELVRFRQDNTVEGTISVSGTTVSYNGGHLSRYAQTIGVKDESLVKGTVLSNLDEMNEYVDTEGNPISNEQLNKVKVSDVEGDVNVAGVFVNWSHDEAHNVDEINMAMTGDMIIRIAQGVVVQKGDLLMSSGDGTAKPQGDDIVRNKTIAKVTSNHVTCTYEDGSYCVPCVLMAC